MIIFLMRFPRFAGQAIRPLKNKKNNRMKYQFKYSNIYITVNKSIKLQLI